MISGKNIVLTGCNSGIGLEVLKLFVKSNNRVLAVDRDVDNLVKFDPERVIVMEKDVSSARAVDEIFARAEELFGFIDIFYANAGYAYYEEVSYCDWDRVQRIFETNVFSPIYTYQKYLRYLNGRPVCLAVTISAIGEMAMPGYAIYSSSKFALNGFQQAIRLEAPANLQITCLYPVATDTNFFKVANAVEFEKPFPVQKPDVVARKMVSGIEHGKKYVSPCFLFAVSKVLMGLFPFVRDIYWKLEYGKLVRYEKKQAKKEK
jgi:short-subunit dehydrogenase